MTQQENTQPLTVYMSDTAARKLSDDPRAQQALARKNSPFGDLDSAHSTGRRHKADHASSRQGKREKKVRW
ncbi:hypothetical protein GC088_00620 [Arthrobacter sp. JZ12]|uniref:hypothetical protein n=1 Tax=Arthrobacter sp. JZ12 TaxID=2654190 RepID=UPI002B472DAC|nr:hypothetical protein [Arthrobacter sp. JZ12]WRH23773.1 hypothetical protein GC088_00620 [Arthrobacter sp. JZ12]